MGLYDFHIDPLRGMPERHPGGQHQRRHHFGAAHRRGAADLYCADPGTGSIASYTTFSTWMLETHRLSEQRQHRHAITNVAASIALGLAAAATGLASGAHL